MMEILGQIQIDMSSLSKQTAKKLYYLARIWADRQEKDNKANQQQQV